jgi:hypothetical protein
MHKVENSGENIVSSDFWSKQDGVREIFISWTEKTCRMLARNLPQELLKEIEKAQKVLITRGVEANQYEILFEDNTDTPPLIVVDVDGQSDKAISKPVEGLNFALWENGKKILELPALFRLADTLPFAARE